LVSQIAKADSVTHRITSIEQRAASFVCINIPIYLSKSGAATAALTINGVALFGIVAVTKSLIFVIDNGRVLSMLVVNER